MIVIDTTAVVNGLMPDGASRERLASDELHVPHLTGSEVVSTLTRLVRNGRIEAEAAKRALDRWAMLGAQRHAVRDLMPRMWALRDDVKAQDATYAALAERLDLPLVTCDKRLSKASGLQCEVVVLDD